MDSRFAAFNVLDRPGAGPRGAGFSVASAIKGDEKAITFRRDFLMALTERHIFYEKPVRVDGTATLTLTENTSG